MYILAPDLSSLYREVIMRIIKECGGISIGGRSINNPRYPDDRVLIADTKEKLQLMFSKVKDESKNRGLTINVRMTKCMEMSKNTSGLRMELLRCRDQAVETVESFEYLESLVTEDMKCDAEIRKITGIAKNAFGNMRNVLANRQLSTRTTKSLIKTHGWSILLYGVEG